jgi:NitT/TauT family transport system permease protein
MNRAVRLTADRLVILVLCVAAWQACTWVFGAQWFSSPWSTAIAFWHALTGGLLLWHAGYTAEAALWGLVLGTVPAVLLPLALRRSPVVNAIIDPYLVGGYGMPKLALAPLFILWFGIGIESKIALVTSIVFFVIFFNTMAGVRAVSAQHVGMARIFGASEADIARHIVWPGAVPYIFAGLKISAPYAIGAAVVGELISSNRGIGYLVGAAATDFDTRSVFVALLGVTVLVLVVNTAVERAERWLLRWRPPEVPGSTGASGAA